MKQEDRDRILQMDAEHVLAITIYGEARGESIEGKIGVGNVIRNRVKDKRWPDTYQGVCIQPMQFSCWNDADPNSQTLLKMSLRGKFYDQTPTWRQCLWVAHGIVNNWAPDNTGGANHYHTIEVNPSWNTQMELTATIGRHKFYKG